MNTHEFDTTEAVDSSLNTTSDCHIEAVLLANKHSYKNFEDAVKAHKAAEQEYYGEYLKEDISNANTQ